MSKTTLTYLILVAVAVAVVVVEVKASEKRVRGGLTSGGGGEVDPNLRFGCTDPHALNWDPRANAFGIGEEIENYTENVGVNQSVCQYFNDRSGIDDFSESYRTGLDLILDVYNRRDVCWSSKDPDEVVIRWMQNKDPEKATNPITACHMGEYFIGAIEAGDILAAPVGTFMDSEHSARDQFNRSLYRPQDGDTFDVRLFTDYLTEQHDPTKSKSVQSRLFTTPAVIDFNGVESIQYFNDEVMLDRVLRLQQGDFETRDWVYGRPFMVGDARIGTYADIDLDGNAVITNLGHSAPNNELGGVSILNAIGDENAQLTYPLEQAFDLDRDGKLSFWEGALTKGYAYDFYLALSTGMSGAQTNPVWSKEELGILKYDGVACSNEDPMDVQNDPSSQVLCFPFNDMDLALMERAKEEFDEQQVFWSVVGEESGQALSDFNRCMISEGSNTLICLDRVPNAPHALGLALNMLGVANYNEEGSPTFSNQHYVNPFFHDAIGHFQSTQPYSFQPASWPHDYGSAWDGVASKSCPSSHPNFIRFCHTTQTLPNQVGETIEIIENDTTTDV